MPSTFSIIPLTRVGCGCCADRGTAEITMPQKQTSKGGRSGEYSACAFPGKCDRRRYLTVIVFRFGISKIPIYRPDHSSAAADLSDNYLRWDSRRSRRSAFRWSFSVKCDARRMRISQGGLLWNSISTRGATLLIPPGAAGKSMTVDLTAKGASGGGRQPRQQYRDPVASRFHRR